jgi:hypothetical protein
VSVGGTGNGGSSGGSGSGGPLLSRGTSNGVTRSGGFLSAGAPSGVFNGVSAPDVLPPPVELLVRGVVVSGGFSSLSSPERLEITVPASSGVVVVGSEVDCFCGEDPAWP